MERKTQETPPQLDAWALATLMWQSKVTLLIVTVVAALVAFVICKLIPPTFESHMIMVPGSSMSRDKQIEEFRYGYDADSERLMQFLNSDVILDSLEQKFSLARGWDIDKTEQDWWDKLVKKSKSRIAFHKTRHASVVVSVQDEMPERAADIANYAFELVNSINTRIVKENAGNLIASIEQEYNLSKKTVSNLHDSIGEIQSTNSSSAIQRLEAEKRGIELRIAKIRDSLQEIRSKYQIFDYGYQVNVLNEQLAEARSALLQESGALEVLKGEPSEDSLRIRVMARLQGAQRRVDFFDEQLRSLGGINSKYTKLLSELDLESDNLVSIETELSSLKKSIEPKVASRNLSRLEYELDFDRMKLEGIQAKYEAAMSSYLHPLPLAHLVSPARPSYSKIYPKTLLSMVFAVVGSILFAMVMIGIMEHFRLRRSQL